MLSEREEYLLRILNDVSGAIENMIALCALPNPSLSDESM
jgi:hypothetical protein